MSLTLFLGCCWRKADSYDRNSQHLPSGSSRAITLLCSSYLLSLSLSLVEHSHSFRTSLIRQRSFIVHHQSTTFLRSTHDDHSRLKRDMSSTSSLFLPPTEFDDSSFHRQLHALFVSRKESSNEWRSVERWKRRDLSGCQAGLAESER